MTRWLITGGAGFIGQHLARSILEADPSARVQSVDLVPPAETQWRVDLERHIEEGRLNLIQGDIRDYQTFSNMVAAPDVIANLAAVHREPGHRPQEYFETNVKGAENTCKFARQSGCHEIIFTSSISIYGVHDQPIEESSQTSPKTPYGQSKLEAEQIHLRWAADNDTRLDIIRPGVVFGPGERGNVSRLMREMTSRRRAIYLRPDFPKAGIYVEELTAVIHWLRTQARTKDHHRIVNGVSKEVLTFNAFGTALEQLQGFQNRPFQVSARLLRAATTIAKPLGVVMPPTSKFHPDRLAKVYRANDIRASALTRMGYPFAWPLDRALADWLGRGL